MQNIRLTRTPMSRESVLLDMKFCGLPTLYFVGSLDCF